MGSHLKICLVSDSNLIIKRRLICDALGLDQLEVQPKMKKNIVLEAEMVAFSDGLNRIDGQFIFDMHRPSLLTNASRILAYTKLDRQDCYGSSS